MVPDRPEAGRRSVERRSIVVQLATAQVFVVTIVLAASVIAFLDIQAAGRRGREIEEDSLRSIQLIGNIRSSAAQENLLALSTSLQRQPDLLGMTKTLSELRAGLAQAAISYQPLTTEPGEAEGWAHLRELLRQNQLTLDRLLSNLSLGDLGGLERQRLELLSEALQLEQGADQQVEVNRLATQRLVREVQQLHQRTMDTLLLALVGAILVAETVMAQAARRLQHQAQLIDAQLGNLEAVLSARENLVASASHELKSPITALLLLAERPGRSSAGSGERSERAELLVRLRLQSRRIARMLDRILDATELSEGRVELRRESVDLAELLQEVVADLEDLRQATGSELAVEAGEAVGGYWDRNRLEQVVGGLISNAFKYGAGRPVQVRLSTTPEQVRLEVQDHGEGIPAEAQERIFERFGRASGHRRVWGLGMGLWSIRTIVEAHGGAVEVRSQPGEGSTFVVSLPRSPLPRAFYAEAPEAPLHS